MMSTAANAQGTRVDEFFTAAEARFDRWRRLLDAARAWEAGKETDSNSAFAAFQELKQWEDYFAYPGPILMRSLEESIASDDARRTVRLVQLIDVALLTHSYRSNPSEWDGEEQPVRLGEGLPGGDDAAAHRPYFEVLVVTPLRRDAWPEMAREYKKLRRPQDRFIYELVFVGSFEDAVLASIVNGNIESVIASDGVPFASSHDAPVLREFLLANLPSHAFSTRSGEQTLELARALKQIRPELDIFLLSGSEVEKIAGDATAAEYIRRIFYQVEEPLELHLSILDAIADRFETPYFDNLQKYAQRPMGTFHALPVARGKSIFKSNWIRDMGRFYGMNLFLAESSATTGGLDSLLEPTGNIKVAQEKAARALGADRVFFVTNGTSTSNKMVEQALLRPGDIAIVDRNCHKSHHYGMVLAGAQPLYVEAFPMTEYSMYGAVPLKTIKQALLSAKADGRLDRVKLLDLTNCTFDGHIYNTRRVMEECLAIKPGLIFLWDEAWFGFARFSPFLRRRTAMGAANEIEAWMHDPKSVAAYEKQQAELGKNPPEDVLLETRLIPDPRQIRLRVYQTNSTHKSMSAIRQGSMLSVKDVEFHTVEQQFKEAVFTHASTSPNQQLIASLDVSRRQMELEGYGLVANAIEIALAIRHAVNNNPLISKYFRVLGADAMVPAQYRQSG